MKREKTVYIGEKGARLITSTSLKFLCNEFGIEYQYTNRVLRRDGVVEKGGVKIRISEVHKIKGRGRRLRA